MLRNNDSDGDESNRTSGKLIAIEEEAEGVENSHIEQRKKINSKDKEQRLSHGRASKTLRVNEKEDNIKLE